MRASDLSRVNKLTQSLSEHTKKHELLKGLLTANKWGIPHQVRIDIGGDQYGNGKYKTVITDLQNVEYVVKLISKEISDTWGTVVGIRAKLRELGVEL